MLHRHYCALRFGTNHQKGFELHEPISSRPVLIMLLYRAAYKYHKESPEATLGASRGYGPEVNADKTEYTGMSRHQNAGKQSQLKST
jgi:hypothetical protein